MLTDKDINKLLSLVATKDDVRRIEEQITEVRDIQREMFKALDRLATAIENLNLEYAAMSEQLSRHERWIRQIAKQAGISLKE